MSRENEPKTNPDHFEMRR